MFLVQDCSLSTGDVWELTHGDEGTAEQTHEVGLLGLFAVLCWGCWEALSPLLTVSFQVRDISASEFAAARWDIKEGFVPKVHLALKAEIRGAQTKLHLPMGFCSVSLCFDYELVLSSCCCHQTTSSLFSINNHFEVIALKKPFPVEISSSSGLFSLI